MHDLHFFSYSWSLSSKCKCPVIVLTLRVLGQRKLISEHSVEDWFPNPSRFTISNQTGRHIDQLSAQQCTKQSFLHNLFADQGNISGDTRERQYLIDIVLSL